MLVTTGLLTLGLGAFTLSRQHFRVWQGLGALACGLVLVGSLILVAAIT
jgi:hypothetical protein